MGTAKIADLKENFTEISNELLEDEEFELLEDDRLNALIDRKLEEAMDSLHNGGKRYTEEEVDDYLEKVFLRIQENVSN